MALFTITIVNGYKVIQMFTSFTFFKVLPKNPVGVFVFTGLSYNYNRSSETVVSPRGSSSNKTLINVS